MKAGDVLGARYEIEALAGAGGMGAVYRARDRSSDAIVAVKVLTHAGDDDASGGLLPGVTEARFLREARVLAQLDHPGIVRYIAHGFTPGGAPYLVMEWMEGETFEQRLKRAPISDDDALALCEGIAEALGYVHSAGIVHRDVKPSNVMLAAGGRIRLVDFGIARLVPVASGLSLSGAIIGTFRYMAPEQAGGESEIGPPADVHGLGACAYRALTGRAPYDADDAGSVLGKLFLEDAPRLGDARPDIDPAVCAVVDRMIAKAAAARFPDGTAAAQAIAAARRETRVTRTSVLPPSRATLTDAERRVASVIAAILEGEGALAAARATVAPFGAQVAAVDARTLVATLATRAEVREQAAQAVRCAGALLAACPGARIVVATGRSEVKGTARVGDAIDRAVRLVRDAAVGVALDDVTAGLVAGKLDPAEGTDAPRMLLGRARPCVGRERELALLELTLEQAAHDSATRAVLIVGDAGVGKTRLLHELRAGLHAREIEPWVARTDAITAGAPFGMLAQLLHCAAGIAEGEPEAARCAKIAARVALHIGSADAPRVAAFLGEICGARFDANAVPVLRGARRDPQVMGDQMRRAWEDFVAAEARARPVVLVLEDLHWGDVPSVKLVGDALAHARGLPFVVIASARPEVHRIFPALWEGRRVTDLPLLPLTEAASKLLARHVLGDGAPAAAVDRLVHHAQGNALFLEELIRAESEGRRGAFPETVLAMVHSRLEELDPECRRALRAASVFGQAFWVGGVRALFGGAEASALDVAIGRLVARELVDARKEPKFPGESELFFRHETVREAAYATLTERDRVLAHREAGVWLEAHGEGSALALAEHFERGGVAERAAGFYLRATKQALAGHDFGGALARAERGVACAPGGPREGFFRLAQAEAHRWASAPAEGAASAALAMSLLPRGAAAWFDAVAEVMTSRGYAGDYGEVERVAGEAGAVDAEADAAPNQIACLARGAMQLMLAGRYDAARGLSDRAFQVAGDVTSLEPRSAAFVHLLRSWNAYYAGKLAEYLTGQEAAARAFAHEGDVRTACREWVNFGHACMEVGAYERAIGVFRVWRAPSERIGLSTVVATALQNEGLSLSCLGQHDAARAVEEEALALARSLGNLRLEAGCHEYLSIGAARVGDFATAHAQAVLSLARVSDLAPLRACVLATLSTALLGLGDVSQAVLVATEAMEIVARLGALEEGEARVRLAYIEALLAAGDHVAARAALADAKARLASVADAMAGSPWLAGFLERVPENVRTLTLAL